MRTLVWFRSDLRARDNTALLSARRDGEVVGVFIATPEQWDEHDWGGPKRAFVIENVRALSAELAGRGIPLKFENVPSFVDVPAKLVELCSSLGCEAVSYNREYEWNERLRDEAVENALADAGIACRRFDDCVEFAPGELLTGGGGWYSVFSPFKKKWRALAAERGLSAAGKLVAKQDAIGVEADAVPSGDSFAGGYPGAVRRDLWPAGEAEAKSRLAKFCERAAGYKNNRDIPSVNGTSTLSPYLAAGVISHRQCIEAVLRTSGAELGGAGSGVEGWIDELIWREFYKHVLVGFPRVSRNIAFKPAMDAVAWSDDEDAFAAWCEGRTGYPIVDAAMRQLVQTGWMHNRLRMIVAMFLTKDLLIDWRWGERFFAQHLVDLDLGSNNGGWQWSASTGTDAQPYFRIFNPTTQGEKFDKDGAFIKKFVPELTGLSGKALHEPSRAGLFGEIDYPPPIVDHRAARERTLAAFKALS